MNLKEEILKEEILYEKENDYKNKGEMLYIKLVNQYVTNYIMKELIY